jgi:S1-C subfamily serine protease
MTLEEAYESVSPTIVALGSKLAPVGNNPVIFPDIIGTGFVVDSRGLIATNRHVAEPLQALPIDPSTNLPAAFAMFLGPLVQNHGHKTRRVFFREIKQCVVLSQFKSSDTFYAQDVPDIAFLQVDVRDIPAATLETEDDNWRVGSSIATAGYAMGNAALVMYNKISQITPLLRHGIMSSNLPYSSPKPHGFSTDIMTQGGESGSPFFDPETGHVTGLLHAGFPGTNITVGVPSWLLKRALDNCLKAFPFDFSGSPTLTDVISQPGGSQPLDWKQVTIDTPADKK